MQGVVSHAVIEQGGVDTVGTCWQFCRSNKLISVYTPVNTREFCTRAYRAGWRRYCRYFLGVARRKVCFARQGEVNRNSIYAIHIQVTHMLELLLAIRVRAFTPRRDEASAYGVRIHVLLNFA